MKNPSAFLFGISHLMAVCLFTQAGLCGGQKSPLSGRVIEAGDENSVPNTHYFAKPSAIGHDDENIYVLDSIDSEIRVFSKRGSFRYTLGRKGQGPAEFDGPNDFCFFGGKIYISDAGNGRIQVLDRAGKFLGGFKVPRFPKKVLVLDEDAVVVSHLPEGRAGDGDRREKLVQCFSRNGRLLWEAVDSLAEGDPAFDIMQNRHVLKPFLGGFFFLRMCNDPWIRGLDLKGRVSRTVQVDNAYERKTISIPSRGGKKRKLSGLYWDCDTSGDFLYMLIPEFSEKVDLVAGKRIAILSAEGKLVRELDLPARVSKFSIDGDFIYAIDSEFQLRIFKEARE